MTICTVEKSSIIRHTHTNPFGNGILQNAITDSYTAQVAWHRLLLIAKTLQRCWRVNHRWNVLTQPPLGPINCCVNYARINNRHCGHGKARRHLHAIQHPSPKPIEARPKVSINLKNHADFQNVLWLLSSHLTPGWRKFRGAIP